MRAPAFLIQNAPFLAAGALLTFMSSFGQTFFISVFGAEIRSSFGLSHGAWGGIYTLGTAASAIVMVWAGSLTDIYRVRLLGPAVLVALAAACLAMALNPFVALLPVVIFALRLFGQGMSSQLALVAMARWFAASRGKALSIATLGFAVGEAILPVTFVALMVVVDWHLLWIVAAAICLAGVPVIGRLLAQERTPQTLAQTNSSTGMGGRQWSRRDVLRDPLLWVMVPAILGPPAFNTAFFFHQAHFAEIKDWRHVDLVAFFPLYTGIAVAAMLLSGWALDRVGATRLMVFAQLPMVAAFVIFAVATGPAAMLTGLFFLALTTGANATLPNAFWAEVYGTAHIGAIKAMVAAVMVLGSAIGPGVTGLLIDLGFGLETQFLGIAAYFVGATLLMWVGVQRVARTVRAQAS